MMLVNHLDPSRIEVMGIGVVNRRTDGPLQRELERESPVPIFWGKESFPRLAERCDTLVVWGIRGLANLIPGFSGEVVVVSHGSGEWTKELIADQMRSAPHARFVAVSEAAAVPIFEAAESVGRGVVG